MNEVCGRGKSPNNLQMISGQSSLRCPRKSLERYANQIQLGPEYSEVLEDLEDRVEKSTNYPECYKLLNYVKDGSLTEYALRRAKRYQQAAQETIHPFKGFEDGRIYTADELRKELAL